MWMVTLSGLPAHVRLEEDEDFVRLTCSRCGGHIWYSAHGVSVATLRADAETHQCTLVG